MKFGRRQVKRAERHFLNKHRSDKNKKILLKEFSCLKITVAPKSVIQKDPCTPMFTAALFIIAKTWKQPKRPPIEDYIKKMWEFLSWRSRNKSD